MTARVAPPRRRSPGGWGTDRATTTSNYEAVRTSSDSTDAADRRGDTAPPSGWHVVAVVGPVVAASGVAHGLAPWLCPWCRQRHVAQVRGALPVSVRRRAACCRRPITVHLAVQA